MQFTSLSDEDLIASLRGLIGEGNLILARILEHLIEVEERRLHLELACPSMFDFCTRKLGLSEGAAQRRLTAARLAKRFPQILCAIADGRVHLSGIYELRRLFDDANVDSLLDAIAGKSRREIEEVAARLAPQPEVPSHIALVPEQVQLADAGPPAPPGTTATTETSSAAGIPSAPPLAFTGPQVRPLAPEKYVVQFTADKELEQTLAHLRELTSHQNPTGDLCPIIKQAARLLVDHLEKQKFGKTERPQRKLRPSNRTRVTNATRREVVARDGLQCTFVNVAGERCPSRRAQFDHRHPRALGGTGEASNIHVLCDAHNRHAAEKVFGRPLVEDRIHSRQRKAAPQAHASSPSANAEPASTEWKPALASDECPLIESKPTATVCTERTLFESTPATASNERTLFEPTPATASNERTLFEPAPATASNERTLFEPTPATAVSAKNTLFEPKPGASAERTLFESKLAAASVKPNTHDLVAGALVRMGFRTAEVKSALATFEASFFERPIQEVLVRALRHLT